MIRWNNKTRTLVVQLPRMRDRRLWALGAFFILLNIMVSYTDLPLAIYMNNLDPGIVRIFRHITLLGDSKYYLVPLALLLPFLLAARQAILPGSARRMLGWGAGAIVFIFLAIALSGLLGDLIKIIVGRTRPTMWLNPDNWVDGQGIYGFAPFTLGDNKYHSFPSGHANTIVALAMALSFFIPRARNVLLLLALPVVLSRVVITAHFLSDVMAGALLAVFTTLWLRDYFARHGWVFVHRHNEYRLQAPGFLLEQKLKAFLWARFGLPDGVRGRLPK